MENKTSTNQENGNDANRPTVMGSATPRDEFKRVLNTLRENKVMVDTREDGIYIRMAGTESKGECFSYEWAKVKSF